MSDVTSITTLPELPPASLPTNPGDIVGISQAGGNMTQTALANLASGVLGTTVVPGTYTKVQVNEYGQVTLGATLDAGDVETALSFTPVDAATVAQPNGLATLDGSGYLSLSQVPPSILAGLSPQGTWNASTNTPHLVSSVGTNNQFYIVAVAGTTNLNGISTWNIGDWALFTNNVWERVPFPTALGTMATQNANAVAVTGGTIQSTTIDTTNIISVLATGASTARTLTDYFSEEVNLTDFGAKGDAVELTGTVSYSGTIVTISGANFNGPAIAAAVTKPYLLMPFGGDDGHGNDAPVIVQIVSASGTSAVVNTAAVHAFSGASGMIGNPYTLPSNIHITNNGTVGGVHVGDRLAVNGGVYSRPALLYVTITKALGGGVVVAGGTGGPANAIVYLQQHNGHGSLVLMRGTTTSAGTLQAGSTLDLIDSGQLWQDDPTPSAVAFDAYQTQVALSASWSPGSGTITLGAPSQLLARVHLGANVFGPSDTLNVAGISGTVVSVAGTIVVVSPVAVGGGTNQTLKFTDNLAPLSFQVTFAANSGSIVATGTVTPPGVAVGQALSGPGLVGTGDPTAAFTTFITGITNSTTLAISTLTNFAAPTPVNCNAIPFLTGVTAAVQFGPAQMAYADNGVYSTLPPTVGGSFSVGPTGVTFTSFTGSPPVTFGTDDSTAVNAGFAYARGLINAIQSNGLAVGTVRITGRPGGTSLCLSAINAGGFNSAGVEADLGSYSFCMATNGGYGVVGVANRLGKWTLNIVGHRYFPPLWGFNTGNYRPSDDSNQQRLYGFNITGWFIKGRAYFGGSETTLCLDWRGVNYMPPVGPTRPNFGVVLDAFNSFGVSDPFYPNTNPVNTHAGSFNGVRFINDNNVHAGGGIPLAISGLSRFMHHGYLSTWTGPAVLQATAAPVGLGICSDMTFETDIEADNSSTVGAQCMFFLYGANPSASASFLTLKTSDAQFGSAVFDVDREGNFLLGGVPMPPIPNLTLFGGTYTLNGLLVTNTKATTLIERARQLHAISVEVDLDFGGGSGLGQLFYQVPAGIKGKLRQGDFNLTQSLDNLTVGIAVVNQLEILNGQLEALTSVFTPQLVLGNVIGIPVFGQIKNNLIQLGQAGASGVPSPSTPSWQVISNGNTTAAFDHALSSSNAGTWDVFGWNDTNPAHSRANMQVHGNFGRVSENQKVLQVNTQDGGGSITNGSTVTAVATIVNGQTVEIPGHVELTNGGVALTGTLTLPLPAEANCFDGQILRYSSDFNAPTIELTCLGTNTVAGNPFSLTANRGSIAFKRVDAKSQWQLL